jgi:hypothetical protein
MRLAGEQGNQQRWGNWEFNSVFFSTTTTFLLLFLSQTIFYIGIGLWVLTTCFLLRMYSGTFMEGMKMWGMGIGMIDHSYDLRKTSKNSYCSGGYSKFIQIKQTCLHLTAPLEFIYLRASS